MKNPYQPDLPLVDLQDAMRENFSPAAIATIAAFLQPAAFYKPANEEARRALCEVEWFSSSLTELLGVDEHNRLIDELGL